MTVEDGAARYATANDTAPSLVVDGLVGQANGFCIQVETTGWMELSHEDGNQVFLGVDHKAGVEKSAPILSAEGAEFRQMPGFAVDTKSKTVARSLGFPLNVILRNQFH